MWSIEFILYYYELLLSYGGLGIVCVVDSLKFVVGEYYFSLAIFVGIFSMFVMGEIFSFCICYMDYIFINQTTCVI
jgi:hypothetical protein